MKTLKKIKKQSVHHAIRNEHSEGYEKEKESLLQAMRN